MKRADAELLGYRLVSFALVTVLIWGMQTIIPANSLAEMFYVVVGMWWGLFLMHWIAEPRRET